MSQPLAEDILQVRTGVVNFYVLYHGGELFLIDGGFIGGKFLLHQALRRKGWADLPIKGIILTHGHLDHTLNIFPLASESGAWVAAPRGDADHYAGLHEYQGPSKVCGLLEMIGRPLLGYKAFKVDQWLDDEMELPIWDGLKIVSLPGHTDGHIGIYCPGRRLLFSADLFASYFGIAALPPAIFNSHAEMIPASIEKAASLDLEGVLPNHADRSSPEIHLRRLQVLNARLKEEAKL